MRALIDSRMGSRLGHFYTDLATIQFAFIGRDVTGAETKAWTDLADHVDLPCMFSPVGGSEMHRVDQTPVVATHRIGFNVDYPGIDESMRVVVLGQAYDVLLVQYDSEGYAMYLDVELVTE